jgi:hypothetical protein
LGGGGGGGWPKSGSKAFGDYFVVSRRQKQSKAKVSRILRPGNTAFKGQLKLINGFER